MTFLDYLIEFVLCTGAILSFCVLISVPKKAVPASSLVGGLAYVLYRLIFINFGREILAYFLATVFIALSAEICARIYKKPSTVFIFPGIIPLVPGVGLYNSMYCLVQGDQQGFSANATKTVFIAGAIAIAVAVVHIIARSIVSRRAGRVMLYTVQTPEEDDKTSK
ncbi:MAG: threonine/serine exporter [Ruminococcaceae bacterium]|nr:threonine/serine exporter [Oscillospiraceae bacterium]